jgi:hypothetical protein
MQPERRARGLSPRWITSYIYLLVIRAKEVYLETVEFRPVGLAPALLMKRICPSPHSQNIDRLPVQIRTVR